ncbi:MAG TPA: tRNA pseudouridine(55) synthase TruB [Gemmatimonadaceae bacterium]|nr:tRNA pseudouridine(55) synthase TruB [Gemmatimonadaceae bacterium]
MLVDKPAGVSSHDVVAIARRSLHEKRIGHAGTLDPFATGLLILLLGRATRLMRYVRDEPKIYEAIVKFGAETDTEDPSGTVVREAPLPSREALERAALAFVGTIDQVPPAFSAKQVDGERSYDLARAGRAVALAPVAVTIHECALSAFEETASGVSRCAMRVSCAGGTYVRSIARDLARAAASAAHLTDLRRVSAGGFFAAQAFSLESLQSGAVSVAPPIAALDGYPAQGITPEEIVSAGRGMTIEARVDGGYASLIDESARAPRRLVAFGERVRSESGDRWQPRVVMRDA